MNDYAEQHPHFPSGEWEGFYLQQIITDKVKFPMTLELNFKNGEVTGTGSDNVGTFDFYGHYDTENGICKMIKQYHGQHPVAYDGRADDNGIYGTWYLAPTWNDGFHIWPKDRTEKEEEEAIVAEEKKAMLTQEMPA